MGTNADGDTITGSTGGGGTHTHSMSSASTWRPPMARFLLASKN